MKFFLYIKHWQIFTFIFLLPVLLFTGDFIYFKGGSLNAYYSLFYVMPLGIAISQATLYAWLWSVGTNLSQNVNKEELKSGLFKTLIILPVIILAIILIFWMFFTLRMHLFGKINSSTILISSLFVILPVQSFSSVSILYCFYYVANLLKHNEVKKKVKFEDCFKEFILILLFPIGIWFLQPRINKLVISD